MEEKVESTEKDILESHRVYWELSNTISDLLDEAIQNNSFFYTCDAISVLDRVRHYKELEKVECRHDTKD